MATSHKRQCTWDGRSMRRRPPETAPADTVIDLTSDDDDTGTPDTAPGDDTPDDGFVPL